MTELTNWFASNGSTLATVAALICGVVVFNLVMARTIKHRQKTATQER